MKFIDSFVDVTKKARKLPTSEYKTTGKHPIIDQGQKQIAGYTDIEEGLYTDVPAIIFGDHTRVIKYIDTPFFIGADGVKVIKSKEEQVNYNYLYYLLSSVRIPNTGYNRHYKWLKEAHLIEHTKEEQEKIVVVLSTIDNILDLYSVQLNKLDELIKSRFVEMFGDPVLNQKDFPVYRMDEVVQFQGGSQPDKKYFEYTPSENNIRLIQIRDYKTDRYITYIPKSMAKRFCSSDDIMIGRYGPPIFQILKGIEGAYNVALMKAIPKTGNKEFIRQFLKQECLLKYLEGLSERTAGQDGIQMDKLKAYPFPLPPMDLQNQFADFVTQVEKQTSTVQMSIDKLETLKKSLFQDFFE